MEIEIIANDERTAVDRQQLSALTLAVYGPPQEQDDEYTRITWATTEISIVIRQRHPAGIVAHAGALVREGMLDGQSKRIGGIGGVKTHPDVRGQHLGKAVVSRAMELLRDDLAVDFGLLVCPDQVVPFYQRLGWIEFTGELWVDQPQGRMEFHELNNVMVLGSRLPAPEGGVIDLHGFPW